MIRVLALVFRPKNRRKGGCWSNFQNPERSSPPPWFLYLPQLLLDFLLADEDGIGVEHPGIRIVRPLYLNASFHHLRPHTAFDTVVLPREYICMQ